MSLSLRGSLRPWFASSSLSACQLVSPPQIFLSPSLSLLPRCSSVSLSSSPGFMSLTSLSLPFVMFQPIRTFLSLSVCPSPPSLSPSLSCSLSPVSLSLRLYLSVTLFTPHCISLSLSLSVSLFLTVFLPSQFISFPYVSLSSSAALVPRTATHLLADLPTRSHSPPFSPVHLSVPCPLLYNLRELSAAVTQKELPVVPRSQSLLAPNTRPRGEKLPERMRRPEMSLLLGVLLAALLGETGAVTCFAGNSSVPLCSDHPCNGGCTDGVGCYCAGASSTCVSPDCNPNTTTCCPEGLFWHSDSSCCSEVLSCEPACASDEECYDNAGIADCRCNVTMYRHANRSDLVPTTECTGSEMAVSFKKCLLKRFKYSVTGMHLNTSDPNCTDPTYTEVVGGVSVIKAQAVPVAGFCGTELTINTADKKMTFSNVLFVPPDTLNGPVISSTLKMVLSCTFNMTMQTSLLTALHPIIGTVTLPPVNGSGPITATMAAYMSNAFSDLYAVGDELIVGKPLYIGISTTFTDADVFSLRADKCVASPTNNPGQPSVLLISGGCPVTDEVDVQIISNGNSLEVKFQIETFAFQDQSEVYMSCDISLCPKTTPDTCGCSPARSARGLDTVSIQMDPIGISATFDLSSGSHSDISLWAVMGSALLALLSLKMI